MLVAADQIKAAGMTHAHARYATCGLPPGAYSMTASSRSSLGAMNSSRDQDPFDFQQARSTTKPKSGMCPSILRIYPTMRSLEVLRFGIESYNPNHEVGRFSWKLLLICKT